MPNQSADSVCVKCATKLELRPNIHDGGGSMLGSYVASWQAICNGCGFVGPVRASAIEAAQCHKLCLQNSMGKK